jgi:DHA1 family multidrug resistance protein-like MFS transporter
MVSVYVGASVGPLLGGVTADSIGYRAAFGIAGVLLALGGLAVLIFVRERFQSVTPPEGGKGSGKRSWLSLSYWRRSAMAVALGSAPLLALLVMRLLSRLGERATVPVLPLFVESIASADTRVASFTGLISGVAAAAAAVGALFLGRLGDRWGHWKILAVCGLVALACYGCHIFVAAPGWLLPLQAGAGLAIGGMVASINAAVARTAPQGQEGTVYGLLGSAVCTANALGPMAGSAVAAWLGLRMSFLLAAGCFALAAAVAIYRLDQRLP